MQHLGDVVKTASLPAHAEFIQCLVLSRFRFGTSAPESLHLGKREDLHLVHQVRDCSGRFSHVIDYQDNMRASQERRPVPTEPTSLSTPWVQETTPTLRARCLYMGAKMFADMD